MVSIRTTSTSVVAGLMYLAVANAGTQTGSDAPADVIGGPGVIAFDDSMATEEGPPPMGACCLRDGSCESITEDNCLAGGGDYQGDDVSCEGQPSFPAFECDGGFVDISGTGFEAPNASNSDNDGDVVPIGFTFNFAGDDHTEVGISPNGYLTFGNDLSNFTNLPIPNTASPNDLIAPYWDDWNPSLAVGTVHYQTLGVFPNRQFIAQWTNVQHNLRGVSTFQAVLNERAGVRFKYGALSVVSPTVGVENQYGLIGTPIDVMTVQEDDCILFGTLQVNFDRCLFDDPILVDTDGSANRLDVEDFKRDPDIIVVIPGDDPDAVGTVQILINKGTVLGVWGEFEAPKTVTVGRQPSAVAHGQLNPAIDAFLDAAVTNSGDSTITLLFNDGFGTFTPMTFDFGVEPSGVAIADYAGDASDDLAVTDRSTGTVSILENNGRGIFTLVQTQMTGGGSPILVDPCDVDGDGDLDVIVVNQVAFASARGTPGNVAILLNVSGILGAPTTYPVGVAPIDLAVGNLNLEGADDIAVANGGDGTVTLLVSQGGGLYGDGIVLQVGADPLSVEAADIDGDGDDDLVVVATDPDLLIPVVLVFYNIGQNPCDLIFDVPLTFTVDVDSTPNFLAVADFNGDNELDVVTVNIELGVPAESGQTTGSVSVLLNRRPPCPGDANFDTQVGIIDFLIVLADWGPCKVKLCLGDVDGDGVVGILDFLLVLANWGDCP